MGRQETDTRDHSIVNDTIRKNCSLVFRILFFLSPPEMFVNRVDKRSRRNRRNENMRYFLPVAREKKEVKHRSTYHLYISFFKNASENKRVSFFVTKYSHSWFRFHLSKNLLSIIKRCIVFHLYYQHKNLVTIEIL